MATFENFQLQAFLNTEDEMKILYDLIVKDYLVASKDIATTMKRFYDRYLTGVVAPDQYYNTMLQYNRLDSMLTEIEGLYSNAYAKSSKNIALSSEIAVTNRFYRNRYTLSFIDGPIDLSFAVINPHLVEASVFGTTRAWKKIQTDIFEETYGNPTLYQRPDTLKRLLANNKTAELAKLRQTVSTNLLRGVPYKQSAKDIVKLIGTKTIENGKEVYTGSLANSLRVARTEGNRNLNVGAMASTNYARSEGLEIARQWIATLDARTRKTHLQADRKVEDENGFFYVGGELLPYPSGGSASNSINCRCTVIDLVEGVEPTSRRGRNPSTGKNEVFSMKDYDSWMETNGFTQKKGLYTKK